MMREAPPAIPASVSSNAHQPTGGNIRPRRAIGIQLIAIVVAAFGVGIFVARLPGHYAALQRVCSGPVCAYGQLSPEAVHSFQSLGLSLGAYAILRASIIVLVALIWFVIASVLAVRKSDDWLALLVAVWFIFVGAATITGAFGLGSDATVEGHEVITRAVNYVAEFGTCLLVFALFPTRRVVPRAAFWLLVVFGFFVAGPLPNGSSLTLPFRLATLASLTLAQLYHFWRMPGPTQRRLPRWITLGISVFIGLAMVFLIIAQVRASLTSLAALIFYGTLAGADAIQLSRYWRVSSPMQRQQTKWIAFGLAIFVGMAAVLLAPVLFMPALGHSGSFYQTIHTLVLIVASTLLPFAITFAILRYRLWDIDVLINRTLVYGSLTGLLVAIYAGLILGLESLAGAISRQFSQPIVIVVATLVIAALFQPLRYRIQNLIDRRFYRRKYDAEKTLAAFSATLGNEVDLEQIRDQLLMVVYETMQPEHASVWLRKS
jgi:hypothetical protein